MTKKDITPIAQLSPEVMRIFHNVMDKTLFFLCTLGETKRITILKTENCCKSLKCQIAVLALKVDKTKIFKSRKGH